MSKFKVGDLVVRRASALDYWHNGREPLVVVGTAPAGDPMIALRHRDGSDVLNPFGHLSEGSTTFHVGLFELLQEPQPTPKPEVVPARSTDPATSKAAAKPARLGLRERVHGAIALLNQGAGATGTEVAEHLEARLNSVTPRLAELRRSTARIKDSGQRRDGQIVWVAA